MADYEVSADTEEALATYAEAMARKTDEGTTWIDGPQGFPIEGFLTDGTRYSIVYYGIKMVPTGNMIDDGLGSTIPEMAPAPGVYAIMRWLPAKEHEPPPDPSGAVTIIDLPDDSPHKFAE